MSIPILLMGESGTGKSTSLRSFEPHEIGFINVQGKPLPFRSTFDTYQTKSFKKILAATLKTERRAVVIDDFGYSITDYYARHSLSQDNRDRDQFEVFKLIASDVYFLIDSLIRDGNPDKVVYIIMHTDRDSTGNLQPLTVGKLLNEKIKIVGMVTICLISTIEGGEYVFKTNGEPPAKTPMGMFESESIPNDLKAVDSAIREYWGMRPLTDNEKKES